jgi:hypothetical protein
LGKDLYERMAVLAEHLNDVGQALGKSVSPTTKRSAHWRRGFCRPRAGSRSWAWRRTRRSLRWSRPRSCHANACPLRPSSLLCGRPILPM